MTDNDWMDRLCSLKNGNLVTLRCETHSNHTKMNGIVNFHSNIPISNHIALTGMCV